MRYTCPQCRKPLDLDDTAQPATITCPACQSPISPSYPADQALLDRGFAHLAGGDYEQAVQAYDEAIRLHPQTPSAYYHRGFAHVCRGRYDAALADFDTAVRLDATFADAYYSRGDVRRARR